MPCRFLSTTLGPVLVSHPPSWRDHRQVLDGMSGALVIEGIESYLPALAGLPERVLVLRGRSIENDPQSTI